jgi:mono/diheme cytochrome c family protein
MKIRNALLCLVGLTSLLAWGQNNPKTNANVARGKYLVTQIGLCQDCHTPRDQKGEYVQSKWLEGAPIGFNPSIEMPWAGTAPPLAGLDGWTDPQILKFLTTGVDRDGKNPRPPMPSYRFNNADAKAVVAYLRSLKSSNAPVAEKSSTETGNQ